jgi:pentatricopeptide repeat protein
MTSYDTLLHELYKLGDLQQQKLLYMHILDRNVYPSKFTFRIMINCLCKEGSFVEALNYVIGLYGDNRLIGADLVSWLNKRLIAYGRVGDVLDCSMKCLREVLF